MKKLEKRIISYVIAVVMIFSCITFTTIPNVYAAAFDIMIDITADKETVHTDDILTVAIIEKYFHSTVSDDNNPMINGIQVEIPIDTDIYEFIEFVNVAENGSDAPLFGDTNSAQSANANYDSVTKSVKCVGLENKPFIKENDTNILIMKFKLKAKKDATVQFSLGKTIFDNIMYKDGKDHLQYSVIQFSLNKKYGDANNDGRVSIEDAVILKKHLAGMKVFCHLENSDINDDGQVNSSDAVLLLKHLAGIG